MSEYSKIEAWHITIKDEHGQVFEFDADIPESLSSQIDDLIRKSYETTF